MYSANAFNFDKCKPLTSAKELSKLSVTWQEWQYDEDSMSTVTFCCCFFQDGKHDLAYFAPDCFHFSDLGSNEAGKSLWNNMVRLQNQ